MAAHSRIVGGSTAKRVIACPGSVALVDKMPPKPSSKYADEGTLLHDVIAKILESDTAKPEDFLGMQYNDITLTEDLIERKLAPALASFDALCGTEGMEYAVESVVDFGSFLPDVFGSADVLGRIGDRAYVVDWKFGDGVPVSAEENYQLMFYGAAAMRTPKLEWVFKDCADVELVIIQPPHTRRWVTSVERIKQFESELFAAVNVALKPDAPLAAGDHCRWCAAKPLCPVMTGALDRVRKEQIDLMPVDQIAHYLDQLPMLENFIKELQQLAHGLLEEGKAIPGWKLVNKRATRQWTDAEKAAAYLMQVGVEPYEEKIITPAAADKLLKKAKKDLPSDLVVAVSSGSTLAPEDDPRPSVVPISQTLKKAMAKIQ